MTLGAAIPYGIMAVTAAAALWRGAPYPAALLFLAIMAVWYTTRMVIAGGEPDAVAETRAMRRERTLTTLVFIGMIVLPLVCLATPLLDFARYTAPIPSLAIGLVCAAVGLWLFWRSHADLGRNWSPHLELRQTHRLISSGIYARIRHPMYAAIFALTAAQTLLPNNWIAGPAGLVTFTVLYVIRIGPEEDMMRDRFGAEWVAYAAGTRRLFPFPKPRSSE